MTATAEDYLMVDAQVMSLPFMYPTPRFCSIFTNTVVSEPDKPVEARTSIHLKKVAKTELSNANAVLF